VQDRQLKIGQRSYKMVVLPPWTENLDGKTWDLLNEYVAAGGKVIAATPLASNMAPRRDGAIAVNDAALATWNPRWQRVEAAAVPELLRNESAESGLVLHRNAGDKGKLFHMRRRLSDGELLFLVNTSIDAPSSGRFISTLQGVEKWDLETGKASTYTQITAQSTGVQGQFELPPCGSLLLFLSKTAREPKAEPMRTSYVLGGSSGFEIRRLDPNVLVIDYVDITAGGESRTNVYFYQANQFAFQKNGMERNPWDSAVQFKDELIRKTFPAGTGFTATYRFTVQQQVPRNLAIVIERPDLYSITCNGRPVQQTPGAWWLDKAFGRIELFGAAQVGQNEVTIKASPFSIYHEIEPAYVIGDFALNPTQQGFVVVPEKPLAFGHWNNQGYPFYSGGVSYEQRFNLGDVPMGDFVLSLPQWRGSVAKVMVNGTLAGYIGYAPWKCDVTPFIWNGDNTIQVIVIGTLKNTLGPHHGKPALGTAWPGMFQRGPHPGPPAGLDYDTVGYGLVRPFEMFQAVQN
jgi:hypothetical protein